MLVIYYRTTVEVFGTIQNFLQSYSLEQIHFISHTTILFQSMSFSGMISNAYLHFRYSSFFGKHVQASFGRLNNLLPGAI